MTAVLVSGAEEHVSRVGEALRAHDADVTAVTELTHLPDVCGAAGRAAFDSYVQLGVNFRVEGATAIERMRHFYGSGVLGRFTALAAVLPTLVPGGRVTFVLGALPWRESTYDASEARRALTRVLAHAARADANGQLAVRMLDADAGAERIALTALGLGPASREVNDRMADLSYADWRVEMMGTVLVET